MLNTLPLTFGVLMIVLPMLAALYRERVHVLLGTTGVLFGGSIVLWSALMASPDLHAILAALVGFDTPIPNPRYLGILRDGAVIPFMVFLTLWLLHWLRYHRWGAHFGLSSGLLFWVLLLAVLTALIFPAAEFGDQPYQPGFIRVERPEPLVTVLSWSRRIARYATLALFVLPFMALTRHTTKPKALHAL